MTVTVKPDTRTEAFGGKDFDFCSGKCQTKFQADPWFYASGRASGCKKVASANVPYTCPMLARATLRYIKQNLFFAFAYNALGVPIAAGLLSPVTGLLLSPVIAAVGFWATRLARIGWRCGCPCAFRACMMTPQRARVGWAARRLTGGPGPEVDLPAFLDRRDPEKLADKAEPFADRAGGWLDLMAQAADLHPITRACMGFHLWSLAGLGQQGDRMEATATAVRIAASDGKGAVFAPLAMGGAGGCALAALLPSGYSAGSTGWRLPA